MIQLSIKIERVDFIKMDIEGELSSIKGIRKQLKNSHLNWLLVSVVSGAETIPKDP